MAVPLEQPMKVRFTASDVRFNIALAHSVQVTLRLPNRATFLGEGGRELLSVGSRVTAPVGVSGICIFSNKN